jgi:hypothetical protein
MLKQKSNSATQSVAARTLRLAREYRLHDSDSRRVIENFFISLDTAVSLSCYLMFKYGEYDQLVSKDLDPGVYNDAIVFRDDFAAISFLRKNASLKTSFQLKERALATFKGGEDSCKESNIRLRSYLNGSQKAAVNESILNGTIRKIDRILGEFSIDRVLDMCGWGPGSTLTVTGEDTSSARKFDVDCDFTKDAYALFGDVMIKAYPLWENLKTPSFKIGNKIITVPKNAKTDRTIAVEPGGNSWIQSGIGRSIRRRLRFSGYNLNSDLKNQRGAYQGSVDDSLATIDFKAASDTISIETVRLLLPPTWFSVLDAARSRLYVLGKDSAVSQKFSTMGNGFTFELESLIFLAIGLACCEYLGLDDDSVSIFGDDLVVPSECVPELTAMCTFLGFTINTEKSFSSGYFRESCGSYYFDGVDVKPIFLKSDPRYARDLFRLANAVRTLSHRHAFMLGCDRKFYRVWSLLVHLLPSTLRLLGPVSSGDSTIHVSKHESSARTHPDGWCGYLYTGLPSVSVSTERESHGMLLARLNAMSRDRSLGNETPLRGRVKMVYKKNMFTHQWYDFGEWVSYL